MKDKPFVRHTAEYHKASRCILLNKWYTVLDDNDCYQSFPLILYTLARAHTVTRAHTLPWTIFWNFFEATEWYGKLLSSILIIFIVVCITYRVLSWLALPSGSFCRLANSFMRSRHHETRFSFPEMIPSIQTCVSKRDYRVIRSCRRYAVVKNIFS